MNNNAAYKTPTEIKDYEINWDQTDGCGGPVLQPGEEVASSTWAVSNVDGLSDLVASTEQETLPGTATKTFLSGGTAGEVYDVTNTVITNNSPPRTYTRTFPCYVNAVNYL